MGTITRRHNREYSSNFRVGSVQLCGDISVLGDEEVREEGLARYPNRSQRQENYRGIGWKDAWWVWGPGKNSGRGTIPTPFLGVLVGKLQLWCQWVMVVGGGCKPREYKACAPFIACGDH